MNILLRLKKLIRDFALKIEKRTKFAVGSVILTALMLLSSFFFFNSAWIFIPLFIIATYLLTYICLIDGIERVEWLMLFLMPVLFTVSFYFFYFLFPVRWITRLPFITMYLVSIYALFLVSNIFNVGVEKNLQLYRAAFSVNYLYQTIVIFFIFNVLFSLRFNFLSNTLVVTLVTFVLALHLFWTIRLKLMIEKDVLMFAFFVAGILGEIATVVSFIPLKASIASLFLTAVYYSLAGITHLYLDRRLFKENLREYIVVLLVVSVVTLLSLNW